MMDTEFFCEGSGLPAFHSCSGDSYNVNPPDLQSDVSPDLLETLPPEQLASARNMFNARELIIVAGSSLGKRGPCHAHSWIFSELAQQKRKIVLVKRNVRVEVADDVILQTGGSGQTLVESTHLTCEIARVTLRHSHQLYPFVLCGIPLDNIVGAVGRTVAHDDPFERMHGLRNNGSDGEFNKSRLVTSGSDQNVIATTRLLWTAILRTGPQNMTTHLTTSSNLANPPRGLIDRPQLVSSRKWLGQGASKFLPIAYTAL